MRFFTYNISHMPYASNVMILCFNLHILFVVECYELYDFRLSSLFLIQNYFSSLLLLFPPYSDPLQTYFFHFALLIVVVKILYILYICTKTVLFFLSFRNLPDQLKKGLKAILLAISTVKYPK